MSPRPASILFVPVSGAGGSGELARCTMLARGIAARVPSADVRFVVSRHAPGRASLAFPHTVVDRSPTFHTREVKAAIAGQRPDVVVFDNAGRVSQMAAAREAGARVVVITSRRRAREKALRLPRLRHADELWFAEPAYTMQPLTAFMRWKLATLKLQPVILPALFEAPETGRPPADYGLERDGYVLLCPGGGGTSALLGESPARLFTAVALELARSLSLPIVIAGIDAESHPSGVQSLGRLPNADLMALIAHARLVVTGGGDILFQALALHRPCVAAPLMSDQIGRIQLSAARGAVASVEASVAALADAAKSLLADDGARDALSQAAAKLEVFNALPAALESLLRLSAHATVPTLRAS